LSSSERDLFRSLDLAFSIPEVPADETSFPPSGIISMPVVAGILLMESSYCVEESCIGVMETLGCTDLSLDFLF